MRVRSLKFFPPALAKGDGAVFAARKASTVCPAGMVVHFRLLVSGCRANGRGRLCRLGANELGAAGGLADQFTHVVLQKCHWRHV